MTRLLLYISIWLVISSCDFKTNHKIKTNEITKVVFSTGPCRGFCPILSIEADENLNYKLFSAGDAVFHGFYKGKIGQYFWDTLKGKLKNSLYDKIDTVYDYDYEEAVSFEIIIYDNLTTKTIKGNWSSAPDELKNIFSWLQNSYQYIESKKVDTLTFETKLHHVYLNYDRKWPKTNLKTRFEIQKN